MSDDQRQFERISLHADFHGHGGDGSGELLFESMDISAGGTFLKSDLLLERGERLTLEFQIPGAPRRLKIHACVAWVRSLPTPEEDAGMGMTFLEMPPEDRELLSAFLASNNAEAK
jgi:uncharacterized protein (TIGR02266 family)